MNQRAGSAAPGRLGLGLTVDPRNGPVASDAAGNAGQIEDEGPGVGLGVVVGRRDVDAVGVPAHALADLRLLGYEGRRVVVYVYEVDLQRPGASGERRTWGAEGRQGRDGVEEKNSITAGKNDSEEEVGEEEEQEEATRRGK